MNTTTDSDMTLNGWANELRKIGLGSYSDQYRIDPLQDYQLLNEIGLPRFDRYQFQVVDFLNSIDSLMKNFLYGKYALLLTPIQLGYQKYSLIGFNSLKAAESFIFQKISGEYKKYMIIISEYEDNVYGGSIISNENIVLAEITKGLQKNVAQGISQVISGKLTPLSTSVSYSTNNEFERLLIWQAMQSIVRDLDGKFKTHEIRKLKFLRGYFEFAYTRINNSKLRLVFIDAKDSDIYLNL